MSTTHFADRLVARIGERNSRLVVGLDPHWHLIPQSFKDRFPKGAVAQVLVEFILAAVDACAPYAAAFKPQVAFFEQFGVPGFEALTRILQTLREKNQLVIADAKRNDIGSTAQAYAQAYFGGPDQPPPFPADALTVNGYLGSDGIKPFLNPEKGIFVLVKTSNPSSGELQDLTLSGGDTVAGNMARAVAQWNRESIGSSGYGNAGAVIGATYPEHMQRLRKHMPHSLILVPGYGAQGGAEAAVAAAFNPDGLGALINSSRGILFPADFAQNGFSALEHQAAKARKHINRLAGVAP